MKRLLLGVSLLVVVAGCGGGRNLGPDGPVEVQELRRSNAPYFWVGRSFDGLRLTYTEAYQMASKVPLGSLTYGQCDAGGGLFSDGGCAPPLSLQHRLCGEQLTIVIYVGWERKPGRAARAAKALRPLNAAAREVEPRIAFDRAPPCEVAA